VTGGPHDALRDELTEGLLFHRASWSPTRVADALLPVVLRYADVQVAAERERIAGSIAVAIALRDKAGGNTQDFELCLDIARGEE
jgi:hypothetical protein